MNSQKESEKIKLKEEYKIQEGVLYYLCQLKDGRIIVLGEEDTFTVLNPCIIATIDNDITLWQLTQNELKKNSQSKVK